MRYLSEFGAHWRPLLAAGMGLAFGIAIANYTTSLFGPPLVAEFGWERSSFALLGMMGLVTLISMPIAGRLTDLFGVRRIAAIGVISLPLIFLAFSMMSGDITHFFLLSIAQFLLCTTTGSAVYSRVVAGKFDRARGLALAVAISAPAAFSALAMPFLSDIIQTHGWRAGFQALAGLTAIGGVLALLLIPKGEGRSTSSAPISQRMSRFAGDYAKIAKSPTFWLLLAGMFLCNVPAPLATSQMALILEDNGVSAVAAAGMLSAYAMGVVVGRFICGVALDHLPAPIVTALAMGIPALGLFAIASNFDAVWVLGGAVLLMGLSQGAEGDMLAFLVMRYFGIEVFSTVLSLLVAGISLASALGSIALSQMLGATDSYAHFLFVSGVLVVIGSLLFLLLGARPTRATTAEAAAAS